MVVLVWLEVVVVTWVVVVRWLVVVATGAEVAEEVLAIWLSTVWLNVPDMPAKVNLAEKER